VDPHYVIPAILVLLVLAMFVAVVISLTGGGSKAGSTASQRAVAKLPPYWIVHDGDSYSKIAHKTGLTVDQLETFNPYANPSTLVPGQRLKLRLHPPSPAVRPKGPTFHTVRSGETFDSIAAKTHHSIGALLQFNPKLSVTSLQPGDRMRLRPPPRR